MEVITAPGISHNSEAYQGFTITWQEPPVTSANWTANVASDSKQLLALIGYSAKVIEGATRDQMLADAKRFIDGVLK